MEYNYIRARNANWAARISNVSSLTLANARIFSEKEVIDRGWLRINHGRIQAIAAGQAPMEWAADARDCAGMSLLPGFIDLHIHGAAGHDTMEATPAALEAIAHHCARHGVTGFLATTWTASNSATEKALANVQRAMAENSTGARVLGAHLEGPYLNPQFAGAQDRAHIRPINLSEAERWLSIKAIRLLSLAPELPRAMSLIRFCREQGVATAAAHSAANWEQTQEAITNGLRQVTHTFNAMPTLHHRRPGLLGAALSMPELRCEIIADGYHVHPHVARLLYELKGVAGTILITDSVRGAGLPEGSEYELAGKTVRCAEGVARLPDGQLAGSLLTMDAALRNWLQFTGRPLAELWPCVSLTPARAIGLGEELGSIATGKRADLILLDDDQQVRETIVAGRTVYSVAKVRHRNPSAASSR